MCAERNRFNVHRPEHVIVCANRHVERQPRGREDFRFLHGSNYKTDKKACLALIYWQFLVDLLTEREYSRRSVDLNQQTVH